MRSMMLFRLSVWLILCLLACFVPGVLLAQTSPPAAEKDLKPVARASAEPLAPKEMEAVFAADRAQEPVCYPASVHDYPGKIILWDEGPAGGARRLRNTITIKE